jgi:hypothetical protein
MTLRVLQRVSGILPETMHLRRGSSAFASVLAPLALLLLGGWASAASFPARLANAAGGKMSAMGKGKDRNGTGHPTGRSLAVGVRGLWHRCVRSAPRALLLVRHDCGSQGLGHDSGWICHSKLQIQPGRDAAQTALVQLGFLGEAQAK